MGNIRINPQSIVHHCDCMEFLAGCADNQFELAIVDPPYGIGEDGSKKHTRGTKKIKAKNYRPYKGGDKKPPGHLFFQELFRVSKNQIIWGANHFVENLPKKNSSCWIVWDKKNGGSDFADCELAFTSFKTAVRLFSYLWSGMRQEDMKNKETRIHPNQKPIALYKWLLKNYAKPADTILDTHMGSQSLRIACWDMCFDFVGCELDKYYFDEGCARFEAHRRQGRLF